MRTWIITDTHFNHDKLCEYEGRPPDFTDQIIRNCQRVIGDDDLVIHLGDVIVGRNSELAGIMERMPGTWVLVRGNHDGEGQAWYRKRGFAFVCDALEWRGAYLTHIPATALPEGCYVNVHGHFHSNGHRDGGGEAWHQLLAIELTNYEPVNFDKWVRSKPGPSQVKGDVSE